MGNTLWNDVYFRAKQDDVGECPINGCLSSCFDIITRQKPISDPSVLINGDWNKNESDQLNARMNNYIYVRGQSLADADKDVTVHLYYAPSNLLLYPMFWKQNEIACGAGPNGLKIRANKGKKFLCVDSNKAGFNWNPAMITNDHYCLIARACTAEHPAEIPAASDIDTFAKFISTNRSYGWRNVSVIDQGSPDYSEEVSYYQGTTGHSMHVILSVSDAPVGAEVAFDCPTLPGMRMPRTKITTSTQDLGVVCDVPANFSGKITYYFWGNGKKPGDNFTMTLHVVYFVPANSELYQYAKHHEELGFRFTHKDRDMLRLGNSIGPERGIILGQYSSVTSKR